MEFNANIAWQEVRECQFYQKYADAKKRKSDRECERERARGRVKQAKKLPAKEAEKGEMSEREEKRYRSPCDMENQRLLRWHATRKCVLKSLKNGKFYGVSGHFAYNM